MSLSDPIGDMLTIIRNATRAKHDEAEAKRSKLTLAILEVLRRERYIHDFKSIEDNKQGKVRIYLRPPLGIEGRPLRRITQIQRVSRPGLRRYAASGEIPRVLNGLGMCVVSTSRGIMSGDEARRSRVGGEVILKIW